YSELNEKQLINRIICGLPPALKWNIWSKNCHYIIEECLQKNPAERPSARRLLSHSFITAQLEERDVKRNIIKHLPR
ncbi:hypothetical protein XELAEV_18045373mg, partial [Xenopus laevis]